MKVSYCLFRASPAQHSLIQSVSFNLSFSEGHSRTSLAGGYSSQCVSCGGVLTPLINNTHPYAQSKMLASSNKLIFAYIILFFKLLHPDLNTVHDRISISIKVIIKSTQLSYLIYRQLKTPIFKAGFLKIYPNLFLHMSFFLMSFFLFKRVTWETTLTLPCFLEQFLLTIPLS